MSGWVAQLLVISSLLFSGASSAIDYAKSLPPRPSQDAVECHNDAWEQSTLVDLRGQQVHEKLAPFVQQLQSDARAEGLILGITSGYRTCKYQGQLRAMSCGYGEYNMTLKPIDECAPPTEPAGRSLHNEGLAVDFNCQGYGFFINSPCYRWLKANGARYFLFEHRLEPWHWSTTSR